MGFGRYLCNSSSCCIEFGRITSEEQDHELDYRDLSAIWRSVERIYEHLCQVSFYQQYYWRTIEQFLVLEVNQNITSSVSKNVLHFPWIKSFYLLPTILRKFLILLVTLIETEIRGGNNQNLYALNFQQEYYIFNFWKLRACWLVTKHFKCIITLRLGLSANILDVFLVSYLFLVKFMNWNKVLWKDLQCVYLHTKYRVFILYFCNLHLHFFNPYKTLLCYSGIWSHISNTINHTLY